MTRQIATAAWIVVVWVIASGSLTVGSVLAGALTGILVTTVFRFQHAESRSITVRPVAAVRCVLYFIARLVEANLQVAVAVIFPSRVRDRRGIVAVPVTESPETLTWLLANAVQLTPGTSIVDMRADPSVFYVHVLLLRSVSATRIEVLEMQRRILAAFGSQEALEDVDRRIARLRAPADVSEELETR